MKKRMKVMKATALMALLALSLIATVGGSLFAAATGGDSGVQARGKTQGVTWEKAPVARGKAQGVTWESAGVTWE